MTLIEYINREERGYFLPFMGANGPIMKSITMEEVYASPQEQLKLAMEMDERFPGDFIYPLGEGNIFCNVLGIPLKKPDYGSSMVMEHPIGGIEDLEKLEIPDPYINDRMRRSLKSFRLIAEKIKKPLFLTLQGPLNFLRQQ